MSLFPTKVLAAIDGSEEAELALSLAVDLAHNHHSELHIVHAAPAPPPAAPHVVHYSMSPEQQERYKQSIRRDFEELIDQVEGAKETATDTHLRFRARADEEIVDCAEDIGAGLIVMGSRGLGGLRRALLGSTADSVVRHAHCPVMVVRRGERVDERLLSGKVVVAVDGSEESNLAARTAADLFQAAGSELHVVHVRPAPSARERLLAVQAAYELSGEQPDLDSQVQREIQQRLDEEVRRIEEAGGEVAQTHGLVGHPEREIVNVAEDLEAGLIVMGSRGLGAIRRALMDSVSEAVVRHAHCPVMVVRDKSS